MNNLFSDFVGILFFVAIYIPINIVAMLVAALLFNLVNRAFRLQFPSWVVAAAAAIMVFVLMMTLVSGGAKYGELDFSDIQIIFYVSTFIINTAVVLIMLSAAGIKRRILKIRQRLPSGLGNLRKSLLVFTSWQSSFVRQLHSSFRGSNI